MSYIPDQQNSTGAYVATTNVWDIGQLQEIDLSSTDFRELLVRLYQNINNIALILNTKHSGYFLDEEFVTSGVFFNPVSTSPLDLRSEFRLVVNVGQIVPGANTKAHGLTIESTWIFTRMYGAVTSTGDNRPVPSASLELKVDATNIVITNSSAVTFTSCIVVLEYLKY
jgi:hypothetical protein